jgi:anti-anti-sigma factor
MEIGEERTGEVLVLAPVGRLDSVSSGELERLVIDLGAVEYISSAGLRALLLAAKRLKPPAGALVLCGIGPSVRAVLDLAGFTSLFAAEKTRGEAVARASRGAGP